MYNEKINTVMKRQEERAVRHPGHSQKVGGVNRPTMVGRRFVPMALTVPSRSSPAISASSILLMML